MISDKRPVQDFVALCETTGLNNIIITPGSRNAPFSISFWNHPSFKTYSIVDERSAGFFALGMSQQLGIPTVLICTSGTAALNFAPAIAEAYYQQIPLLIVTADRPLEWVDQGEGQTIRQRELFRNFVKGSFEIVQEASDEEMSRHNIRQISSAIALTTSASPGPVHINFPLRESLYKTTSDHHQVQSVMISATSKTLEQKEMFYFSEKLKTAKKILVLTGQLAPDEPLKKSLVKFASHPSVVVMTETHSNLSDPLFIGTTDRLIMGFDESDKKHFQPDILITVGENIISRKIKALLRSANLVHWHIDESGKILDTFLHLEKTVPVRAADFFEQIQPFLSSNPASHYGDELRKKNDHNRKSTNKFLENVPFSDLSSTGHIISKLPAKSELQMGNSSVVRYIQLFDTNPNLIYRGNRGVSGIDGCSSTAVGAAFASKKRTTLITGELAFFYDSNAFWNQYVPENLKIVVINNGGGGIFRIIEGPSTSEALEPLFETAHDRRCAKLAEMYNLPYRCAENMDDLVSGMTWLNNSTGCSVLEVITPRLENDRILKSYFKYLAENKN